MKKKANRIPTSGDGQLTSNPFEQLTALLPDVPPSNEPPPEAPPVSPAFTIMRTKKGGLPIAVERRAAGKSVTIVKNVSGDTHLLCELLKKHCAAGGKASNDAVEIQGNHLAAIESFIKAHGF